MEGERGKGRDVRGGEREGRERHYAHLKSNFNFEAASSIHTTVANAQICFDTTSTRKLSLVVHFANAYLTL